MPRFKTTQNIFSDHEEFFDENWMDSNTLILPKTLEWDYKKPLMVEDVDLWEVIYEESGRFGVYASYVPYAEFYLINFGFYFNEKNEKIETFYGPGSDFKLQKRLKELGVPFALNKKWIDNNKMWLYSNQ